MVSGSSGSSAPYDYDDGLALYYIPGFPNSKTSIAIRTFHITPIRIPSSKGMGWEGKGVPHS